MNQEMDVGAPSVRFGHLPLASLGTRPPNPLGLPRGEGMGLSSFLVGGGEVLRDIYRVVSKSHCRGSSK